MKTKFRKQFTMTTHVATWTRNEVLVRGRVKSLRMAREEALLMGGQTMTIQEWEEKSGEIIRTQRKSLQQSHRDSILKSSSRLQKADHLGGAEKQVPGQTSGWAASIIDEAVVPDRRQKSRTNRNRW